jgi:Leucine-rich repeat (LRR) protein
MIILKVKALRRKGYDSGELDDYVLTENIKKVTELKLDEENIKDLTGIEDFVALEELYCSKNQLTHLDVSKNTALKKLWCYDNQLTRLDVSKNRALVKLNCINNNLTSIDVSKNAALTFLGCDNNQLTHFDFDNEQGLKMISGKNTGIIGIEDLQKC